MSVAERQNWHSKQELCVYAILAHLGVRIVSHSGKILNLVFVLPDLNWEGMKIY